MNDEFTRFKAYDALQDGRLQRSASFVDLVDEAIQAWGQFKTAASDHVGGFPNLCWPHLKLHVYDGYDIWEPLTPEGNLWLLMNIPPEAEALP